MSAKSILAVVLVAVAIAIPFAAPAVLAGMSALAIAGITAALEIGVGLAQSVLLGPKSVNLPKTNPIARLYATLDTTAPRKIVFGTTAGATDVRYQAYTGTNQEYYEQIIADASHTCNSNYELWIDNEKAWASSGGVQGRYVGYLTVDVRNPGTSSNGIAIDSTWTASCTLTGCAYLHLKFLLIGPDDNTPSPFQGGVSNRLTIRTKGALTYDPRLDSTVAGGSGTQRAATQSTWAWSDNGSRNPALQLLWYLLGWEINGKLAVGMGINPSRLDLASFITAANICDEAVSLKAGGTEPRYRSDGVISEGDDRSAVIDTLCATMNATLRDSGGKISIDVLHDDLSSYILDFGLDDIIGNEQWQQTPPLSDYHNIVRGRFVDPSDNALYQLSDYPEQSLTSPDGTDRIDTVDYPMVQSGTQAQRLAKLRLMRNQYQGRYSATFGPRAWGASIGRVVRQTHDGLSWANKQFRVVEQGIGRTGQVPMTLLEENSAIYVWTPSTDEKSLISAGTPPVADPTNNPVLAPTDEASILRASYPVGFAPTATDAGSDVTISAPAFKMDYATTPPTEVNWPAMNLTHKAYSTTYYFFADVDAVGDATPVYGVTTTYGDALNSSTHPKRIFLNRSIDTPAAGGAPTTGGGVGGGPGGGFDDGGSGGLKYPV